MLEYVKKLVLCGWESHLEMLAQTQDLEFGQGQSRDVPDRELALNIDTALVNKYQIFHFDEKGHLTVLSSAQANVFSNNRVKCRLGHFCVHS